MLFSRHRIYENASMITMTKDQATMENSINKVSKCDLYVSETEWHDLKFIITVSSTKSRLRDVFPPHSTLMIALTKVYLGKETWTTELVKQIIDSGNSFTIDTDIMEGISWSKSLTLTKWYKYPLAINLLAFICETIWPTEFEPHPSHSSSNSFGSWSLTILFRQSIVA